MPHILNEDLTKSLSLTLHIEKYSAVHLKLHLNIPNIYITFLLCSSQNIKIKYPFKCQSITPVFWTRIVFFRVGSIAIKYLP